MENSTLPDTVRKYYEKFRTKVNEKVLADKFGWTPCEHYNMCIGWCPKCLELKKWAQDMNEIYGNPNAC